MAQVTINVPDNLAQYHLDAFAASHGYNPATDGTKYQFFCRTIKHYIEETTLSYFCGLAADQAREARHAEYAPIVLDSITVT